MHLRRSLAPATGALLLVVLSACGTAATDRIYTPAAGVQERSGTVDVLGAAVVSAQPGSGTFVASFANNVTDANASVSSVEGVNAEELTGGDAQVEIPAGGLVNLADEGGIPVTGEFQAGDFVAVTIEFGDGSSVQLDVPVVTNCDIWEGLDGDDTSGCEAASDDAHSE